MQTTRAPMPSSGEELPSLARMLRRGELAARVGQVWSSTEPIPLQPQVPHAPAPFAEPIDGLQVREIDGDGVFSHFFGDSRATHPQRAPRVDGVRAR